MWCIRSCTCILSKFVQFSNISSSAPHTSERLCGCIDVDIPTAIPVLPLTIKFGNAAGKTVGSCNVSSKLSMKSTVCFCISVRS